MTGQLQPVVGEPPVDLAGPRGQQVFAGRSPAGIGPAGRQGTGFPGSLVPRDSGQKKGQRAIQGGRSVVRRALYICAWSVIRVGGPLRLYYQGLRQRGKPGKGALVAVIRKLLLHLNTVARRGTPWASETA